MSAPAMANQNSVEGSRYSQETAQQQPLQAQHTGNTASGVRRDEEIGGISDGAGFIGGSSGEAGQQQNDPSLLSK